MLTGQIRSKGFNNKGGAMRRTMALAALLVLVGSNTMLVTAAMAQGGKGTVSGRVTDSSDAVLQGAEVTLEPGTVKLASNGQGP